MKTTPPITNPILDLHDRLALAAVRFSIEREEEYALFLKERYPDLYEYLVISQAN